MRAARALDMLLILQRQGRTSAGRLAAELEVTPRTILRDVQVLSEAGVPIFTTRGANGGIELLDGFETHLTGLTTDEAQGLFLADQPLIAHRLGLGAATRTARAKLLAALPDTLATQATTLSSWFLQDPDPWHDHTIAHGELRRIASSIRRRRRIELTLSGKRESVSVRPLGLVLKAGTWHLVHDGRPAPEVLDLGGLCATRLTNVAFTPPDGFKLADFWAHYLRSDLVSHR